jgi:hypothetical protein
VSGLCAPYCEVPCSPACATLRLTAVEWVDHLGGPPMARIAAVEGLRPRDLVGGWVQIDDYACHVQAAYGSRGVEFALMLDERSPMEVSE